MQTKKCYKCYIERDLFEFDFAGSGKHRRNVCKKCRNARLRERMKDPETRKRHNAIKMADYYRLKKNPEWYSAHLARNRFNYRRNYPNIKKNRPYLIWARSIIMDHRKKGVKSLFKATELESFLMNNDGRCYTCGNEFDNSIWNRHSLDNKDNEHILTLSNIRILCNRCNTMKGNLNELEFVHKCTQISEYALNRAKSIITS